MGIDLVRERPGRDRQYLSAACQALVAGVLTGWLFAFPAHARSEDFKKVWCGPPLKTSPDEGGKSRVVQLSGHLTLKNFPTYVWDEAAGAEILKNVPEWILVLDYETPVLSDIIEHNPGRMVRAKEMQLFKYEGRTGKYTHLLGTHVLVTGRLQTAYRSSERTAVYIQEDRVDLVGPTGCDGQPVSRH